jgi:hypothetical protein
MVDVDDRASASSALVRLLELGRRARHAASADELSFLLVNESFCLGSYRQAALWLRDRGVRALSGVSSVEGNAPFVQWLSDVARHLTGSHVVEPKSFSSGDLPPALAESWIDWLPAHALWLPLGGGTAGALLLAREESWQPAEIAALNEWCDMWSHAWLRHTRPASKHLVMSGVAAFFNAASWRSAPGRLVASLAPSRIKQTLADCWRIRTRRYLLLASIALLLPVRLTVLAPGELVPANPAVIRSPLDGVVEQVLVQPNAQVHAGEPLFVLDHTTLESRLGVATQALATAEAEYRQQAQLAVFDVRSKSRLAALQGVVAERQTEAEFLKQQLERATITATQDGVVLFEGPSEWIGKPVVTGERLATVANEHDVEIEAWLSPGDLITLPDSPRVTLYLNTAPLSPVSAKLRYQSYMATQRPDGTFAYRLRATLLNTGSSQRVGLKGTAKVSGHYVPLVYWVLRRPLALMRQALGV